MIPDTIVAVATPPGTGGVAILRLSGPDALRLAMAHVRVRGRSLELTADRGRELHVGHLVDARGAVLDEVVVLVFRAPHSYTTEDVVEFQVHAGPAATQRALRLCLEAGARLAAPGEFTRRAFLGGRLELTQAEAIADLTSARSERALAQALEQLEGRLGAAVRAIRAGLLELVAELEATLDFPDELPEVPQLPDRLQELMNQVDALLQTAGEGRLLREGATLVLLGRPNVGKSSLLNALAGEERAIVTASPGTTRDVVEAGVAIGGVPFRVLDTAGLREALDEAERHGIARARAALTAADVRLVVVEAAGWGAGDELLWHEAQAAGPSVLVANKIDRVEVLAAPLAAAGAVPVAAVTGAGLAKLEQAIYNMASGAELAPVASASINARHQAALIRTRAGLARAGDLAREGGETDLLTVDLREALVILGTVTGEAVVEEVIDHIFSRFCVGK